MTALSAKHELRARMRADRKRLALEDPQAAERAAGHIDELPGKVLQALYWPVGSELDPRPLAKKLRDDGCDLCLPVVIALDMPMIFRRWSPGDPLEVDQAGVPAPLPLAETVVPDLILTPLLAFDDHGVRLGQGGGYYDRTFAAMPNAVRVGVAYIGQRVARLPAEAHDIRLHGVLTETGYRAFE